MALALPRMQWAASDTATTAVSIAGAFKFKDDGPSISRSATSVPSLTADDSDLVTNPSASFTADRKRVV